MKNLIFLLIAVYNFQAFADEGMWTLNNFPSKKVKEKYGVDVDKNWLQHAMLSSARLAGGCSASFVSKDGLIMTNHHCAHSCIEQLSNASKDYVESGFYAKELKNEVKCPEIEIDKLIEISDVTARVNAATRNLKDKSYNDKIKATLSTIESECSNGSDIFRCDVVTLYRGGQYHLYKYRRYQDVRLVFAPEFAAAFFGGDPDNFTFPRYDLDVSFLRVYENNAPLKTKDYFQWSPSGPSEGDVSFVIGNPGSTSRQMTVTELKFLRDNSLMDRLLYFSELRGMLTEFSKRGPEQKRISNGRLFGVENSLKALKGKHEALVDEKFMAEKSKAEQKLKAKVNGNPKLQKLYGNSWSEIDKAYAEYKNMYRELENIDRTAYGSRLFEIAKTLVRAADEIPKPNGERFMEFTDARLPQLKQSLFSEAPIYNELEIALFTFHLTKAREILGANHPFVKQLLGKRSPAEIADELIKGTKLSNVKEREKLFAGGKSAVEASQDPMISFYKALDPETRRIRKAYEDNIESKLKKAEENISKAEFAVYGTSVYPNATFSMRISYGQVKGYEQNGNHINPITDFEGAFARNTGREPYALPQSWINAKSKMNLKTGLNFCSTNDIIGGNSGSPVINKNAEIIGLIFDGNIQSLGGDYGYDESVNRAVSVDSAALIESLQNVYGAQRIVQELRPTSK